MMIQNKAKEIQGGVDVLGKNLEAFLADFSPYHDVVFSQRGLSRSLEVPRTSMVRILESDNFKTLCSKDFQWSKIAVDGFSRKILVITKAQLSVLVKLLSEIQDKDGNFKYPIPKSMQDAGFPLILQQSVDEVLGVSRSRKEYLDAGATLRQKLEYKYSYHKMKDSTFQGRFGVTGLCQINKQISSLAVPDADERRKVNKDWRRNCTGEETVKITIGNTIHQKAVEASTNLTFEKNFEIATFRTQAIYQIMDQPFS